MMKKFLGALLPVFLLVATAHAEPRTGFTLIGAPKHPNGFTHYDFVNPKAPKGGTITFGVTGSFDSLQPWLIKGQAAAALNFMYDTLMARSPDEPFTLYPLIAKSVDWNQDKKTLAFKLDARAHFHDGKKITADDVAFSFEKLKQSGRPNTRRMYAMVGHVSQPDPLTIVFEFKDGHDSELPMILAMMTILPKHFWKDKVFDSTTLTPPLGSGPYKIQSLEPGRRIIYERVANYWAKNLPVNIGLHNFDTVRYDYYRDDGVALQAFNSGAFDVRRESNPARWETGYDSPALRKGQVEKAAFVDGKPEGFRAFVFNMRQPQFQDRRVRQALGLAFDFEWVNRTLYRGAYKRTTSIFPKSVLAAQGAPTGDELKILAPFRATLVPDVFGPAWQPPGNATMRDNLRRAEELLKAANYELRGGRMIHRITKVPLQFEILLNDPADEKLALEYSRSLARIGILASVRTIDSAQYTGRLADYSYDMIIYKWISTLSPGSEQLVYWGSQSATMKGSRNYAGIHSQAVDAIAQSLTSAPTYNDLITRAHALDRVLMHSHYFIPLFYQPADWVAYWNERAVSPPRIPLYGALFESWWHK